MSDSLQPHGLQHARLPCPSPSPRVCSNPCPLSWWCHPTISSSVARFSSCLQSFPASGFFSNESALHIVWPKDRSFSFSISPCSEYSGLIPLRIDWFDLLFEESSLEKRKFTIWTMSYFPQTHWGHWSCLPLSDSYTFPSKESLSGCSGRCSGSSKLRPQCLVECSSCPLHSTALPTSMATIISILTAKLMSQALGLHRYHLIQSSYNTGTWGKYNIIPTLQRRKRRLRKHRRNLASDAINTLTSEVICLTSYLTTTLKDLLFSGISKQETWGHIGKKQDLQRGNIFSWRFPFKMVSELTLSRSNKGFVVEFLGTRKAEADTESSPGQFSKHSWGVYRASLGQLGWGGSPFRQEKLRAQSCGVPWQPSSAEGALHGRTSERWTRIKTERTECLWAPPWVQTLHK